MTDDLDRLFERLVSVLADDAPGRLAVPFPAAEVYERLVPYRSNRSRLKVATHQDYEMAVLRLLAGEGSYVHLEPDDVREGMRRETAEPNPDPAYFRSFPDALVMVNGLAAERVLRADKAYAPPAAAEPEADASDDAGSAVVIPLPARADVPAGDQCQYCGGMLPSSREVNFCPHCGQPPSGDLKCPACGSEVDVGWGYCISCGRATGFE